MNGNMNDSPHLYPTAIKFTQSYNVYLYMFLELTHFKQLYLNSLHGVTNNYGGLSDLLSGSSLTYIKVISILVRSVISVELLNS